MVRKNRTIRTVIAGAAIIFASTGALSASDTPNGMNLSTALDQALEQNPYYGSAKGMSRAARADVWDAKSGFLPKLRANAGYTHYEKPSTVTPIHEAGRFPELDDEIYKASVELSMSLFSGGRTLAETNAARAGARERDINEESVRLNIIHSVASVYISAQELNDKEDLVGAHLGILRQRYNEFKLLLDEGRVSYSDIALLQASLESVQADSLEIESKGYELNVNLGQLVGGHDPVQPFLTDMKSHSSENDALASLLPDTSLIYSDYAGPEVRRAHAQLGKSEAMLSLSKRSFLPEIGGFAAYNYFSPSEIDISDEWVAGVTLSVPLFEGGSRIAKVKSAKAYTVSAKENLKAAQQTQTALLKIAYDRWKSAKVRRQYLTKAVEHKLTSVTAQRKIYETGRISLSELLTQETELLDLQMQEKELIYAELMAILDYHSTAGTLNVENVKMLLGSES
ncbi:MAG: TolC family protein [Calditrichaceae bacterium]